MENGKRNWRIKESRKKERQLAKDVNGRTQPGSGNVNLAGCKGDVRRIGKWRLEHKFTNSLRQYTLKLIDLVKITKVAINANELPALILNFKQINESFAIIPYLNFLEILNEIDEYQRLTKRR